MLARRLSSWILAISAQLVVNISLAQTTAGSGTVLVVPLTANIAVYTTEVFVRNPNTHPITLNVIYYQSNDGTPPAGFRPCAQLTIPATTALSFDMGSQCGLNNTDDNFGMFFLQDAATPKVNPSCAPFARTLQCS
jgi:hypothetical protein